MSTYPNRLLGCKEIPPIILYGGGGTGEHVDARRRLSELLYSVGLGFWYEPGDSDTPPRILTKNWIITDDFALRHGGVAERILKSFEESLIMGAEGTAVA